MMPREVRDLHLPDPRMHEGPRRQEQDRRLALSVNLVEDAHSVALDAVLRVGVAGAGLLAPLGRYPLGDGHLITSAQV
jgi:hypothetical protein